VEFAGRTKSVTFQKVALPDPFDVKFAEPRSVQPELEFGLFCQEFGLVYNRTETVPPPGIFSEKPEIVTELPKVTMSNIFPFWLLPPANVVDRLSDCAGEPSPNKIPKIARKWRRTARNLEPPKSRPLSAASGAHRKNARQAIPNARTRNPGAQDQRINESS
jgi:hypothetical protein